MRFFQAVGRMTSIASSTVTMPSNSPSSSTTGSAKRSSSAMSMRHVALIVERVRDMGQRARNITEQRLHIGQQQVAQ